MYSVWVMAGIFFIWLLVLTFLIWQQNKFLKSVFPKSGERDIRRKFEETLAEIGNFENDLGRVKEEVKTLEKKELEHIQRVEFMRFNPYNDTGGDQSFMVVLLDDKGSGVLITSLHARSGTRIFAKDVIEGKSGKYEFSKEEEKIIKQAMNR